MGPARRVGVTRAAGCWRSRVVWGAGGCWAMPGPRPALRCSCTGQPGRHPRGRGRGAGHEPSVGTADRRVAALPPGLGAGRPSRKRAGTRLAAGGARGAAPTAQDGAVCGRPPRIRLRPTYRHHVWAHPVWLAARTHKRAAPAAAGRGRTRHTRQYPGDRGGPTRSRADKCALHLQRGCSIAHRSFPAHPGAGNAPQGSPTGPCRPGLAAPLPARPPPGPAAPEREQPHPRRAPTANPRTSHTGRENLHTLPGSPSPQSRVSTAPTTQPPPHKPPQEPPTPTTPPTQTPPQTPRAGQVPSEACSPLSER